MSPPYENATSGANALEEIGKMLTRFGCARFGTVTDNDAGNISSSAEPSYGMSICALPEYIQLRLFKDAWLYECTVTIKIVKYLGLHLYCIDRQKANFLTNFAASLWDTLSCVWISMPLKLNSGSPHINQFVVQRNEDQRLRRWQLTLQRHEEQVICRIQGSGVESKECRPLPMRENRKEVVDGRERSLRRELTERSGASGSLKLTLTGTPILLLGLLISYYERNQNRRDGSRRLKPSSGLRRLNPFFVSGENQSKNQDHAYDDQSNERTPLLPCQFFHGEILA